MTPLTLLFCWKIVGSFPLAVMPFLLLPKEKLEHLTQVKAENTLLFRLYGMAVFALLFGYAGGVYQVSQGQFPWGPVIMGIVSNGGASLLLSQLPRTKQNIVPLAFFGSIAVALIFTLIFRNWMMTPLF